jgi:hypothetical protein
VIDTDRGRKVKLDTARSSGGKEPELRGLREKEKKERGMTTPVYFFYMYVCVYIPTVLYLLLLQITGQQRESATSV